MEGPGFFSKKLIDCRVAIWGLGLMGGSLAMALQGKCADLVGVELDDSVVRAAIDKGIVSCASGNAQEMIGHADVIILSTPVQTILQSLDVIQSLCHHPVILMDLGSTKREIIEKMKLLPAWFDPIGGHPMCGKEKGTWINADPKIYQNAAFALVELNRTSKWAKEIALEITQASGSIPFWIDPELHDRWVSVTSHTPYLIANALVQSTPVETTPLIGPGFRSTTRLAGNPTQVMVDILATNKNNILDAIDQFKQALNKIEHLLQANAYDQLAVELTNAAEHYRDMVKEG